MNAVARCRVCKKPLTDEVSIALGIGPECRQGKGKHAQRAEKRIERTHGYLAGTTVEFVNVIYRRTPQGWTSDGIRFSKDDEFLAWLRRYNLIDEQALKTMSERMVRRGTTQE